MQIRYWLKYEVPYRLGKKREEFWRRLALRLPKPLQYWTFINLGVQNIKSDEVVPEVPYTTVLQRIEKGRR